MHVAASPGRQRSGGDSDRSNAETQTRCASGFVSQRLHHGERDGHARRASLTDRMYLRDPLPDRLRHSRAGARRDALPGAHGSGRARGARPRRSSPRSSPSVSTLRRWSLRKRRHSSGSSSKRRVSASQGSPGYLSGAFDVPRAARQWVWRRRRATSSMRESGPTARYASGARTTMSRKTMSSNMPS